VDGEECVNRYGATDGLHGSRRLAAQLAQGGNAARVRGVLIVDMVGDSNLTVRLPENGTPALMQAVLDAATAEGARRHFGLGLGAVLDDHVPFLDAGLPAVDIIDFEYGSAPGLNDYWHTAADTVDKLSADSLRIAGRVVARAVNVLLGAR
jgi:Zn-dependent M28 family amino/carboxypeptidase